MTHVQKAAIAAVILMILIIAIVGTVTWLWEIFWKAYDKKWKRIPNAHSYWAGHHAPSAQRRSQTQGHV